MLPLLSIHRSIFLSIGPFSESENDSAGSALNDKRVRHLFPKHRDEIAV
jgi:hypothetical protein